MPTAFAIRPAVASEIPVLRELIDASVRRLQSGDYSPRQIDSALKTVFDVDSQLVNDGTYLLVEAVPADPRRNRVRIVPAAAGVNGRRFMAAMAGEIARMICLILKPMLKNPRIFYPS